jgi:hypothetical protein
MCRIKKTEDFNQGMAKLLAFFNLAKVARDVLQEGNCG